MSGIFRSQFFNRSLVIAATFLLTAASLVASLLTTRQAQASPVECGYEYRVFEPGHGLTSGGYSDTERTIAIVVTSGCDDGPQEGSHFLHQKNGSDWRFSTASQDIFVKQRSLAETPEYVDAFVSAAEIRVENAEAFLAFFEGEEQDVDPDAPLPTIGGVVTITEQECESVGGTFEDGECDRPEDSAPQGATCESVGNWAWWACPIIRMTGNGLTWIDQQIGRLLEVDETSYDNPGVRSAWTTLRNIAYLILVPILLVMVIGTALGLDFVSAYTVKRALPRLVVATVFISLSYAICVFLIGFFNAVGQGTLGLLTAPFGNGVANSLSSLYGLGSAGDIIDTVFLTQATIVVGIIILLAFFLPPILVLAITAFLILLVRQMFIVLFVLVAPLAILVWIFPGRDKLWKSWWGSFSKLLFMYPVIMGIIAAGRIFAYIIMPPDTAGQGSFQGILQPLMALMAYVLPYAAIPFTFKLAGGIFGTLTGMVNDREKGFFDRQRRNRAQKFERSVGRRVLQKRADLTGRLQRNASKGGMLRRGALRFAAARVGGYNIMAADSAKRAQVSKEINDQIATGRDEDIRGLTVNKKAIDRVGWANALAASRAAAARGDMANELVREEDGRRQYKSLGGKWIDEANVIAGHKRWGRDTFAQQTALSYEMRKAQTEDELQNLGTRYGSLATDQWGMTSDQAGGAWIGAAFENQNQHLEYKYTNWRDGTMSSDQAREFAKEVYEKKGSYPLAQMSSNTIARLQHAYDVGDEATRQQVQAIAETFMYRGGAAGPAGVTESGEPLPDRTREFDIRTGRTSPEAFYQTNTPGAAHVAENVRKLAHHVGVYRPDMPPIPKTPSPGPRPTIDPQN